MPVHKKVLVTGASGFIARHIIKTLLAGGYSVVGTVRSQAKAENVQGFFKGQPIDLVQVEDMSSPGAFDHVFQKNKDITAVLHTASPMIGKGNTPEVTVTQAVEGIKIILKAIKEFAPQVTTVVYTSSNAAMLRVDQFDDPTLTITEDSWSSITHEQALTDDFQAYFGSKTFAEREFWRFIEEEKPNFKGTTITPPWVFGPAYPAINSISEASGTVAILLSQFTQKVPADHDYTGLTDIFVAVEDVATLHVLPLEKSELEGQRLLPVSGYFSAQAFLNIANEKLPELRGKIPVGKPETAFQRVEQKVKYDNSKTVKLTGIKWRTLEETVLGTIKSLNGFEKAL